MMKKSELILPPHHRYERPRGHAVPLWKDPRTAPAWATLAIVTAWLLAAEPFAQLSAAGRAGSRAAGDLVFVAMVSALGLAGVGLALLMTGMYLVGLWYLRRSE